MTIPESVLAPRELERVRQVALAVLRTLGEHGREARQPLRSMVPQFLRSNWVPVGGIALALVGWGMTGASPIHALNDVAYQQDQRESQGELVKRHITLGNDFLNLGQLEAAQAEFKQARTIDTYNTDAQFGSLKASVFDTIKANEYDPEIAERWLRFILSKRPDDTHGLAYLGLVHARIDPDSALWYYDQALASDTGNALAYAGKGDVYLLRNQEVNAFEMYERAHSISPWNQVFLNNLGYQRYLRGDYAEADSIYRRLLLLNDKYLLSAYMLANTDLMMGQPGVAYQILQILVAGSLRDSARMSLPSNLSGWAFFVGGARPEELHDRREKATYAHYLMAITAYLSGDEPSARRHLREVGQLHVPWLKPVETIVWTDLRTLRGARPEMRARIDRLERMIWPRGFPWPPPTQPLPDPDQGRH